MVKLTRIEKENDDLASLIRLLDKELAAYDGDEHEFYAGYNKLDGIRHMVVAYVDDIPVGCGALKAYADDGMEVKRMYVKDEFRNKGVAKQVLHDLESWAKESGKSYCILETGMKQKSAVRLYEKSGYTRIQNYGQYEGIENSICMQKQLQ